MNKSVFSEPIPHSFEFPLLFLLFIELHPLLNEAKVGVVQRTISTKDLANLSSNSVPEFS